MGEFVWARRPEKHSSPETMGTRCDGCIHLFCYERDKAKLHRWHYHCDALSRNLSLKELYAMSAEECPEHRGIKRRGWR